VLLQIGVPDGGADCPAPPTIANMVPTSIADCDQFATGRGGYISGTTCSLRCQAGFNAIGALVCQDGAWVGGFTCSSGRGCARPDKSTATCPSFTYTKLSSFNSANAATAYLTDNSYTDDCAMRLAPGATGYTLSDPNCATST
jgi:hypothetical protein